MKAAALGPGKEASGWKSRLKRPVIALCRSQAETSPMARTATLPGMSSPDMTTGTVRRAQSSVFCVIGDPPCVICDIGDIDYFVIGVIHNV